MIYHLQIKRLRAYNYRSFGKSGIDYKLNKSLNILVGENNAGKTNIWRVILQIINCLHNQSIEFNKEDYFEENQKEIIKFGIDLGLHDSDISSLMTSLELGNEHKKDFTEYFGKNISINISYSNTVTINIKMNNLYIDNVDKNNIKLYGSNYQKSNSLTSIPWSNIITELNSGKLNLKDKINSYIKDSNTIITINNFFAIVANLLQNNIISFSEFRERPNETDNSYVISKERKNLAKVLSELKNGDHNKRKKFAKIKKRFSDMFSDFILDTSGTTDPKIVIERKGKDYEVSHLAIGAGIFEILSILTHLIGSTDKLLVFDEPEIHLHPHAQRMLSTDIRNYSKSNQILCITHSPIYAHLNNLNYLKIARIINGETILIEFDTKLHEKIKRVKERIMTSEQKEFLFAKKVILVEGATEFGAIPIISQKLKIDLNKLGISIIEIGGKEFDSFIKLVNSVRIPFKIITDSGTLMHIEHSIKIGNTKIRVSSLIKQLYNLDLLTSDDLKLIKFAEKNNKKQINDKGNEIDIYKEELFEKLSSIALKNNYYVLPIDFEGLYKKSGCEDKMKEAEREFPYSKVLQAKYFADQCKVPIELKNFILKVIK